MTRYSQNLDNSNGSTFRALAFGIDAMIVGQRRTTLFQHFIHAIVAMLAIANPIAATPLFAAITEGMSKSQRRHSVLVACVAVLVILGGAVLVGTFILQIFGIGLDAFRFGGGLVIVLMGLEMLRGKISTVHDESEHEADQEDQILVPFAMPLVAGPGSIATAITLSTLPHGWNGIVIALGAVVITVVVLGISLLLASQITNRLGGRSLRLITRFMGLILVAMGAQFLLAGFSGFMSSTNIHISPNTFTTPSN